MSSNFPGHQVIVLGGGLAGFSAANTVLENGGNVLVLDKMAICGGNSTKATSGINGSETKAQRDKGIKDSNELFFNDTMRGGAKKADIVKVLTYESGPAVDWLIEKFDLDLSLISRLGGHSAERTHRGKERFPGMTITYGLMQMCERVEERYPEKCRVLNKARATLLLHDKEGRVIGCEYQKGGKTFREFGPVIVCTGGFAADFTPDSLLAKHRPELMHLPTTNGEHCTGDGIKMGDSIGASCIDLDWVQVHPTGLVKPEEPDSKLKFLAAEALRGEGGILINANGERFCNELGRRDYVSGKMFDNIAPFRLILNSKASKEIEWHCEHYKGRGIMKKYNNASEMAADMKVPFAKIKETFDKYNEIYSLVKADEDAKRPIGGKYDAYPTGKTYDPFGKLFFKNGPFEVNDVLHVSIVTPVLHYCMGGLEIDTFSRVFNKQGIIMPGLYAAGEVAGGVHGENRLGGNSLLDCVVFGRVAGKHCAQYLYGEAVKNIELKSIAAPAHTASAPAPAPVQVSAPVVSVAAKPPGTYTVDDVAKHNKKTDCWCIINGQVLDVTTFLKDHPGGEMAILTFAGKDASAEFNMIHPPNVIPKYAPHCVIGTVYTPPVGVAAAKANTIVSAATQGNGVGKGFTLEEVAKHNKKTDCWCIINGQVLDVTTFLKDHPGGEMAILTFAGKDASSEFNMIHPPNVIPKYAPHCVIGNVVAGAPSTVAANVSIQKSGATVPLLASNQLANEQWWGEARNTSSDFGPLGPSVGRFFGAVWSVMLLFIYEIFKTIFFIKNYTVPHDKSGLTRSAIFLIVFVVIHGLGNLHVYGGPDHFNGYAYFLNRPMFYGTLFLPVELYLLAAALLHVLVATVRTFKFKKISMITDSNLRGQLSLAFTGALLFVFFVIHLQQFRLTSKYDSYTFRARKMWPFFCVKEDKTCDIATFKDLYKLEFQLFSDYRWVLFYIFAVGVFITHLVEGWGKITAASTVIPKKHKEIAKYIGTALAWFVGLLYVSYPIFCYLYPETDWKSYDKEHIQDWQDLTTKNT